MNSILLVEDDLSLGETLQERLEKEGYPTSWCTSVEETKRLGKLGQIVLAVLDLGLPDGNGFELAKWLKASNLHIKFLFLTAQNSAQTRLEAFELGAEEFIPKPFHLKEL